MSQEMNTSDRVDNQQDCLESELRGPATLVKIPEDVRKFALEQCMSEDEALQPGMEQKSFEFSAAGAEIYSKA